MLVPVGKFKGQDVDMLLAHGEYAIWLLTSQLATLRARHPQFLEWLVGHFGAPETTPEHNRLQNRFLSADFRLQLYLHLSPGVVERATACSTDAAVLRGWERVLPSWVKWYYDSHLSDSGWYGGSCGASPQERHEQAYSNTLRSLRERVDGLACASSSPGAASRQFDLGAVEVVPQKTWSPVLNSSPPRFEVRGADIDFDVGGGFEIRLGGPDTDWYGRDRRDPVLVRLLEKASFRVEVKPFVGDDYPIVLRSMVAKECNVLLIDTFAAAGASWEELVAVFASRRIKVARLEDVLLTPIPDEARHLPLPRVCRKHMMEMATSALDAHVALLAKRTEDRVVREILSRALGETGRANNLGPTSSD